MKSYTGLLSRKVGLVACQEEIWENFRCGVHYTTDKRRQVFIKKNQDKVLLAFPRLLIKVKDEIVSISIDAGSTRQSMVIRAPQLLELK